MQIEKNTFDNLANQKSQSLTDLFKLEPLKNQQTPSVKSLNILINFPFVEDKQESFDE